MQADLDIHRKTIKPKKPLKALQLGQTFRIAWQQFVNRPVADLLTIAVLAVVLALPMGLFWLLSNAPTVLQSWDHSPKVTLYLKGDVTVEQSQALLQQIEKRDDVAKAVYISPEQGLKDLVQQTQMNVADKLANNPLPGVIEILPKGLPSSEKVAQLLGEFKAFSQIDKVQLNQAVMEQRYQALQFAWKVFYFFMGLCVVIALVLMAKQLQLGYRGNWGAVFVQGVFCSLGAGLLAWGLLVFGLPDITQMMPEWTFAWTMHFSELSNELISKFLLLSVGLGVAGAALASALLLIHPLKIGNEK